MDKFNNVNNIDFSYSFDHEKFDELREMYKNEFYIDINNDFISSRNALIWAFEKLYKENGKEILFDCFNSIIILKESAKGNFKFNCWQMALTLTEILLSMGIKAKMIRCMKESLIVEECHCVVHAYSNFHSKWILFDVANKSIYYNKKGIPIDLKEFRDSVINKDRIFLPKSTSSSKINLIKYWVPNLVRFQCYLKSQFNNDMFDGDRVIINLIPDYLNYENKISFYNNNKIYDVYIKDENSFWR